MTPDDLSQRLDHLEATIRRWQYLCLALVVVIGVLLGFSLWERHHEWIAETIIAKRFVLIDSGEHVRGMLTVQEGKPVLGLEAGKGQVLLGVFPDGAAGLRLVNTASGRRTALGSGVLAVLDRHNRVVWRAP